MFVVILIVVTVVLFGGGWFQTLQDNGGLKAVVEKVWCGNAGCDDSEGVK